MVEKLYIVRAEGAEDSGAFFVYKNKAEAAQAAKKHSMIVEELEVLARVAE